nr:low temperature requirement protein A [Pedococcus bigeumensis]
MARAVLRPGRRRSSGGAHRGAARGARLGRRRAVRPPLCRDLVQLGAGRPLCQRRGVCHSHPDHPRRHVPRRRHGGHRTDPLRAASQRVRDRLRRAPGGDLAELDPDRSDPAGLAAAAVRWRHSAVDRGHLGRHPVEYVLWALGLGLDLGLLLLRGNSIDDERLARIQERFDQESTRRGGGRQGAEQRARAKADPVQVSVVDVDPDHLQERLGLFVIIVLGEVVSQLVFAASTREWGRDFVGVAVAAFIVLVGLWWLTFSYGFGGAPHTRMALLQPRFGLPMHLLTTTGVLALAAGFGKMAAEPEHHIGTALRWIMCSGLSLHFLVMTISGVTGGAPLRWLLGWGVPCTLAPLALAAWGSHLSNARVVALMFALIAWLILYARVAGRRWPVASGDSGGPEDCHLTLTPPGFSLRDTHPLRTQGDPDGQHPQPLHLVQGQRPPGAGVLPGDLRW